MAAPPVFLRKEAALAILDEELERVGAGAPATLPIEKQKRPGSQRLTWWHDGIAAEPADPALSLALLRTYVRITGGRALPAGGLRLHKDRVWLDRAVVAGLEQGGVLAFEPTGHFEPSFVLTDKGRRWVETGELIP